MFVLNLPQILVFETRYTFEYSLLVVRCDATIGAAPSTYFLLYDIELLIRYREDVSEFRAGDYYDAVQIA